MPTALRHTARGIVLHNDALLLIERWRGDLHYYSVPGGGIEPGETPEMTVVRELHEETGCRIELVRKLYRLRLPDGTEHHIFLCNYVSGEPHLPADSPEALDNNPDNRFKPGWLRIDKLPAAPFVIWQPVKAQLLHDIAAGFSESVVEIKPNVVP